MTFLSGTFPPSFCSFLGVSKPINFQIQLVSSRLHVYTLKTNKRITTSDKIVFATHVHEYDITRQVKAFNASDEKVLLLTYEYDITLQVNVFITSDELVSASHLRIRYHTADERLSLAMKAFCAGDEHCWHWKSAGDECDENTRSSFSHTHTHL